MEIWTWAGGLGTKVGWIIGWISGHLIQDWILGSRSGSQDGGLAPDMKVWDPDIGLSPRSRSGPLRKDWRLRWRSGT